MYKTIKVFNLPNDIRVKVTTLGVELWQDNVRMTSISHERGVLVEETLVATLIKAGQLAETNIAPLLFDRNTYAKLPKLFSAYISPEDVEDCVTMGRYIAFSYYYNKTEFKKKGMNFELYKKRMSELANYLSEIRPSVYVGISDFTEIFKTVYN
jgi:hypothetical protein